MNDENFMTRRFLELSLHDIYKILIRWIGERNEDVGFKSC